MRARPATRRCLSPSRQVTPARLAELNAESAALIAKWGIEVATSEALGGYLRSTTGIPAGQLALLLPPNLIQSFAEVTNYNAVIQVRFHEQQSERLYSASLTPEDLDNFLSHSCDPHCVLTVDPELTVRVTCSRAIPPLEPISIDYERALPPPRVRALAHLSPRRAELEEDMVSQGVEFDCNCGTALCRGAIVGTRRRAMQAAEAAAAAAPAS